MSEHSVSETPANETAWIEATDVNHDYWRDILSVRTINALFNANLRLARDVFATSDDDLLRVKCLGQKGVAQIRLAQRRVNGPPVAEWDVDALASLLNAFAEDHPQRKVGDAMQEAAKRLRSSSPETPTATLNEEGHDESCTCAPCVLNHCCGDLSKCGYQCPKEGYRPAFLSGLSAVPSSPVGSEKTTATAETPTAFGEDEIGFEVWRMDGRAHLVERLIAGEDLSRVLGVWRFANPDHTYVAVRSTTHRERVP